MKQLYAIGQNETKQLDTAGLRENFLCQNLMQDDSIKFFYTHYDRIMIGGVKPVNQLVSLETYPELRSKFFLERREIGIINVGGEGSISVDDAPYSVNKYECLYIGKGIEKVVFSTENPLNPAVFYLLSCPAHVNFPTTKFTQQQASPVFMGSISTANQRTIYKYIHNDGINSCQLVMGLTVLKDGSVWNTMPAHTHDRRMEAYFYFDVPDNQRVVHFMGQPQETRHLFVANHEAIACPPWSIHSGCGTSNYSFIWGMGGENKDYTDMDAVAISDLR